MGGWLFKVTLTRDGISGLKLWVSGLKLFKVMLTWDGVSGLKLFKVMLTWDGVTGLKLYKVTLTQDGVSGLKLFKDMLTQDGVSGLKLLTLSMLLLFYGLLKGQSKEIFDLQFFHHLNQPGPLTNGLKYFRIWLGFRWVIRIFMYLPGVWYCAESISRSPTP